MPVADAPPCFAFSGVVVALDCKMASNSSGGVVVVVSETPSLEAAFAYGGVDPGGAIAVVSTNAEGDEIVLRMGGRSLLGGGDRRSASSDCLSMLYIPQGGGCPALYGNVRRWYADGQAG